MFFDVIYHVADAGVTCFYCAEIEHLVEFMMFWGIAIMKCLPATKVLKRIHCIYFVRYMDVF